MNLREATPEDVEFLWIMLTHAATVTPAGVDGVRLAKSDIYLRGYLEGWPRPGDRAVIAFDGTGTRGGAAWSRLRPRDDSRHSVATEAEPELLVAVEPKFQGQGIGKQLMRRLLETLRRDGCSGVRLSVRDANESARKLYEQLGFSTTREIPCRDGGISYLMRLDLASPT